jgi:hypothetical protein
MACRYCLGKWSEIAFALGGTLLFAAMRAATIWIRNSVVASELPHDLTDESIRRSNSPAGRRSAENNGPLGGVGGATVGGPIQ